MDVFINYANEDYEMAKRIYDDLKEAGVNPWLNSEDILPGENRKMTIQKAVKESSCFLALFSSNSVSKRGFVQKELKLALETLDEIPLGEIFFIPVRIDDCKAVYERIQDIQQVDLFPSYDEGFNKILRVFGKGNITAKTTLKYKYEIFLSYDNSVERWVKKYFLESLKFWLSDLSEYPFKIYENISENTLDARIALAYSKCLITLWTPEYFKKNWWKYEFQAMHYRQAGTGVKVIIPVILQSEKKFLPDYIKNKDIIPRFYFNNYIVPENYVEGFGKTAIGIEFHFKMKEPAEKVLEVMNQAPELRHEWLNPPVSDISETLKSEILFPALA